MFEGLEYIYEVYKEKSFSKAAANLYISQPSLSATIKKAEAKIGMPVFDRSTNPIRLTECGMEYIKCAEKILDIQEEFENYVNNMDELKIGQLSIGGSNFFTSFSLPPIIQRFTAAYPQIKINLIEANTPLLEQNLSSGTLDLVIDNFDFDSTIYTRHLYCVDHLLLVMPKKFLSLASINATALTHQDIVNNEHLKDHANAPSLTLPAELPFLFLRHGNNTRNRSELICNHLSITPTILLELDQQVTAYHLACYGMGATFISDQLIKLSKADDNVVYYQIDDPAAIQNVYFYHKHGKYITKAMQEFLKCL